MFLAHVTGVIDSTAAYFLTVRGTMKPHILDFYYSTFYSTAKEETICVFSTIYMSVRLCISNIMQKTTHLNFMKLSEEVQHEQTKTFEMNYSL